MLAVVVWVRWPQRDVAEYGWTRSACLSWSARSLKRWTSSEASGEGSLALWLFFSTLSGPDSTSFWSLYLPSVPDSRTPGISVTSGVFVIFEISWDRICLISLSGTHTGEVESYGNTQAYPLLQVNSTSGPFHALVRRSFHLTRGRVIAPSGIQCLIIAVCPCVSTFKWLITKHGVEHDVERNT